MVPWHWWNGFENMPWSEQRSRVSFSPGFELSVWESTAGIWQAKVFLHGGRGLGKQMLMCWFWMMGVGGDLFFMMNILFSPMQTKCCCLLCLGKLYVTVCCKNWWGWYYLYKTAWELCGLIYSSSRALGVNLHLCVWTQWYHMASWYIVFFQDCTNSWKSPMM